jgi:hypothetical protein
MARSNHTFSGYSQMSHAYERITISRNAANPPPPV